MKILNIDYHLDGYTIQVNNCLDYNIAGAISYFNNDYFKLYCAIWCLYKNYSNLHDSNLIDTILSIFGLKITPFEIDSNNVIDNIIKHIDNKEVILFYTNSSLLFYSIVYKKYKAINLNHNIIINGYDNEKEIIFIKENTINSNLIRTLTNTQPFSSYVLTYEMFLRIYNDTKNIINANVLYFIKKVKDINVNNVKKELLENLIILLGKENDNLIRIFKYVIENNSITNVVINEQFYRDYYHSYIALFDFFEQNFYFEKVRFEKIKEKYLKTKKFAILKLSKIKFKNDIMDVNELTNICNALLGVNKLLYDFFKNNSYNFKEMTMLEVNEIIVSADSRENNDFNEENVIKTSDTNDKLCYWKSNDNITKHWLKLKFKNIVDVKRLLIEFPKTNNFIAVDYRIYIKEEDKKVMMYKKIIDNKSVINEFIFNKSLRLEYIKIIFDVCNAGYDFSARIKNVKIYL